MGRENYAHTLDLYWGNYGTSALLKRAVTAAEGLPSSLMMI